MTSTDIVSIAKNRVVSAGIHWQEAADKHALAAMLGADIAKRLQGAIESGQHTRTRVRFFV